MKQFLQKRKRKGFTLVELLIVIIIIGILAGSMLLVMGAGKDKAEATKVVSNLRTMKSAAVMYYADNTSWPTDINDLDTYMDGTIDDAKYDWDTVDSGDSYWVHAITTALDPGVRTKLAGMAADAHVYNGTTTSGDVMYDGGTGPAYVLINQ